MKFVAASLLLAAASPSAGADPAKYLPATLIVESARPRPGSTMLVGITMTPKPGWHGYWSDPGESGFAPRVRWNAPAGVTFGPLLHPAPSRLMVGGLTSFVHRGPHVLLARMRLARTVRRGAAIPLFARVDWAACSASQCVPLHTTLKLVLTAGNGAPGLEAAALRAAKRKLPRQMEGLNH